MQNLADSGGLIGDRDALAGRLATDGYLFFRGLLPSATVRSAVWPSWASCERAAGRRTRAVRGR
jgi:hypothetical protein